MEPNSLSDLCLRHLERAFQRNPFVFHSCFTKLLSSPDIATKPSLSTHLFQIYSNSLQTLLFHFKSCVLSKKKSVDERQSKVAKQAVLTILNLLPDSFLDHARYLKVVQNCFVEVVKLSHNGSLAIGDVYGTLLGRESPRLVQLFQRTEDVLFSRNENQNKTFSLLDYMSLISPRGEVSLQEVFLRVAKTKQHFVVEILKGTVEDVLSGRWPKSLQVLRQGWLSPLRPLTCCLAWKACSSTIEVQQTIKFIQAMTLVEDPLQRLLIHSLQENSYVAEWVSSQSSQGHTSEVRSEVDLMSKKRNVFSSLQNQSPLSAVHRALGLRLLPPQDTLSMLEHLRTQRESALKNQESFCSDQCTLYRAYRTLSLVMDAILSASQLESLRDTSMQNTSPDEASGVPTQETIPPQQHSDENSFTPAYKDCVTAKLTEAKEHLNRISSVTYQTEILENIFSLLFVTHNDVLDTAATPNDSDDGHVGVDVTTPSTSPVKTFHDINVPMFSYSTTQLRDESCCSRPVERAASFSSPSTTSTSGSQLSTMGFLCTPALLVDILDFLKKAIEQTLIGKSSADANTVNSKLWTSISKEHYTERLSRLSRYVSEALWRFEVLSGDLEVGSPTSPFVSSPFSLPASSSVPSSMPVATTTGVINKLAKESLHRQQSKRRKKRLRRRSTILEDGNHRQASSSIMCRMLASPTALLCYSILQRNYKQAKEVYKMFSLKGTDLGQETKFCTKQQQLLHRLNATPNPERDSPTGRRLSVLAIAAAQGLESTNSLQMVDLFLGECTLPTLPEIEMLKSETSMISPAIQTFILTEAQELQTMVLSDIAYTSCTSLDRSLSLLAMTPSSKEHETKAQKFKVKEGHIELPGIISTAENTAAFFNEVSRLTEAGLGHRDSCPLYNLAASPPLLFVSSLGQLSAVHLKEQVEAWQKFGYQRNLVQKMIDEEDNMQVVLMGDDRNNAEILNNAFTRFARLCASEVSFMDGVLEPYLGALNRRLKQVSKVLGKYAANKGLGWMKQRSHLTVLKHSLDHILGHLILKDINSLEKLEELSQEIQMNLVHVIARSCYPVLPIARVQVAPPPAGKEDSCEEQMRKLTGRNPELVVRGLLHEFLQHMQDTCREHNEFNTILTLTWASQMCLEISFKMLLDAVTPELASLDLSLLESPQERLTFYLNVVNVCYLHAIFTFIASQPVSKRATGILSPCLSERLHSLRKTFYTIGQLDSINLFDLSQWFLLSTKSGNIFGSPYAKAFDEESLKRLKDNFPLLDPRIVFGLTQGFASSPKLQVFCPETILEDLDLAMDHYLNFFTEANLEQKTVRLPELLQCHQNSFLKSEKDNLEALLSFVSPYLKDKLKQTLKKLQALTVPDIADDNRSLVLDVAAEPDLPFKIEISPFLTQFGIAFDYNRIRGPPKPPKSQFKTVSQQLPAHANQYISKQCPLVSNLLNLLTSDLSDIEAPLERQLNWNKEHWRELNGTDHLEWLPVALSPVVQTHFMWRQIQRCLDVGNYSLALEYLEEVEYLDLPSDLKEFKELLLSFLVDVESGQDDPWSFALRLDEEERRVRTVLHGVNVWPLARALEALAACIGASKSSSLFYDSLQDVLTTMAIQNKIVHVLNRHLLESKQVLSHWSEAELFLLTNPEEFISYLAEEPQLLVQWAQSGLIPQTVPHKCVQSIWEHVVSWLVCQHPLEEQQVQEALESIPQLNLDLLLSLVDTCPSTTGQAFLVDFALGKLQVDEVRKNDLRQLKTGIKMVSLLPEAEDHKILMNSPLLLLEQLFMRMEVELAELVLTATRNEDSFPSQEADSLIEKYAAKAMEFCIADTVSGSLESLPSSVPGGEFVMPDSAPKKEDWTPDSATPFCMLCQQETFGMFSRRHHCRRCGRLVCSSCSQHTLVVNGYSDIPVRACNDCFVQANCKSKSDVSSVSSESVSNLSALRVTGETLSISRHRSSTISNIPKLHLTYLTMDPTQNQVIRDEFCYEQTPSVSLCLSLLQLHSSSLCSGHCMLAQCDLLFDQLRPLSGKGCHSQVDYALIISMMRTLVLSARVKFVEAGRSEEEAVVCDSYLRSLDLLNMLIRNNCTHLIPSCHGPKLNTLEAVRQLLERLLEEERMSLAMEVSTKCGLDRTFLWAAWGMICLKAGHWADARDKFARCLQKPQDLSRSQQENPLVREIISILENSPTVCSGKFGAITESLKLLKIIREGTNEVATGEDSSPEMLRECQFYLQHYGSPASNVAFLLRHDLFVEAVSYVAQKGWESELFVHGLVLASARQGHLEAVLQQVRCQEPTLAKPWLPLLAACQYLQKNNMHRLLHTIQIFMGDYIRAGMTCIHFYQQPCTDYSSLVTRVQYLQKARQCFEMFLMEQGNQQKKRILQLSSKAVHGYIETVILQTEVTTFLWPCLDAHKSLPQLYEVEMSFKQLSSQTEDPKDEDQKLNRPPTLFDSNPRKKVLICFVLYCSLEEKRGVELAARIIRAHGLNITQVCCGVGQLLVKYGRAKDLSMLLTSVKESSLSSELDTDSVLLDCVRQMAGNLPTGQDCDPSTIIELIADKVNKVHAYIICRKLKSAYTSAIRLERADLVLLIQEEASQCGQTSVANFCERWLKIKGERDKLQTKG